jgi:hypothetical protein
MRVLSVSVRVVLVMLLEPCFSYLTSLCEMCLSITRMKIFRLLGRDFSAPCPAQQDQALIDSEEDISHRVLCAKVEAQYARAIA